LYKYKCTRGSIREGESYRISWDRTLITDTEKRERMADTEFIYDPKNYIHN